MNNNTDSIFSMVNSIEVDIEQVERLSPVNSFGMSLLKLTMNPPVEVRGSTIFGIFQPNISQSDLILQYQLGQAPDNYQLTNTPPTNVFEAAETNSNNDYPLVAAEHSKLCTMSIIFCHYAVFSYPVHVVANNHVIMSVSEHSHLPYQRASRLSM